MIEIAKIDSVAEVYPMIEPLFAAHYDETTIHKDVAKIAPNLDLYRHVEASGRLLCLVAMEGGKVVGYSINFKAETVHHTGFWFMTNDALYVMPEFRKRGLAVRLMGATVRCAREMGVHMMVWRSKPDTKFDSSLPRMGYELLETVWGKRIG